MQKFKSKINIFYFNGRHLEYETFCLTHIVLLNKIFVKNIHFIVVEKSIKNRIQQMYCKKNNNHA